MSKEKRYVVVIDAYIWATSEEEAKKQAEILRASVNQHDDNDAKVISLTENEFGKL